MIEIEGNIVSEELLTEHFCCDLAACKGICCVEGDSGAPLEPEEAELLERNYGLYSRFMTPEGRRAVEEQGFMVIDGDGECTTPLIGGKECAYSCREGGITLCAVERASKEGFTGFVKPLSCHLYPVRAIRLSNGAVGLNYHRWSICSSAATSGNREGIKLYEALREPIIRRFGGKFYDALKEADKYLNN